MKIGFIGLGNMGSAMIGGIIKNKLVEASDIIGSDYSRERVKEMEKSCGISGASSNEEVAKNADILVTSVKPQVYETVIKGIRDKIKDNTVIVSIAPGKTIGWLTEKYNENNTERKLKIVRCMPNTPALVGEGCTGVCRCENVNDKEFETVLSILNSFGRAYEIPESQMDAVVAVSGSSPAYVFMLIEAMADGAVAEGLSRKTAYEMAAQAVLGSAKMVLESGKHPGELKDMVCSPAGTTIDAVALLEKRGFRSAVIDAERVCAAKSRSL
ncbi:MAG: pyrroline-5-carboxylate reductase [Lachnospiraceae bacterium]|nr:pyrroline-5-carboxylate reductase [Lachnospiraceae bacterium]